jgi:hypothetical protein
MKADIKRLAQEALRDYESAGLRVELREYMHGWFNRQMDISESLTPYDRPAFIAAVLNLRSAKQEAS